MQDSRITRLREWMSDYDITFKAVGEHLAVTANGARMLLCRETIPTKRYEQLRVLGFPDEILPVPCDKKTGPRPKQPLFPGLMTTQLEAWHAHCQGRANASYPQTVLCPNQPE